MASQGRPVLDSGLFTVTVHGRQVQQHRETSGSLDKCADSRFVEADDEITFPVPWHCPVFNLGRSLADQHFRSDELPATTLSPGPRNPQSSAGSEAGDQFPAQRPPTLDVQRLVDGLVRDPHVLIIGEIDLQSVRNLLRAPRLPQRRSCRRPCRRPMKRTVGPGTWVPSGRVISPASRSWT